jgi:hypothetical protein
MTIKILREEVVQPPTPITAVSVVSRYIGHWNLRVQKTLFGEVRVELNTDNFGNDITVDKQDMIDGAKAIIEMLEAS